MSRRIATPATIFFVLCALAQPQTGGGAASQKALDRMPEDLETRFALSALPPHLRDNATVHVLDPAAGYVVGKQGTNGFSCFVDRTEWVRADFRDDIYTAICYDAEGAKNHMRVYFDVAAMRAKGMKPEAVKAQIAERFAKRTYVAPGRAGLSYMLAPVMRNYFNPDVNDKTVMTMSMPHFMIYAPNLTDKDIGGMKPPSPYPFIFEQGPHGYMIILLGREEQAAMMRESKQLLADLCSYRKALCLQAAGPHQ